MVVHDGRLHLLRPDLDARACCRCFVCIFRNWVRGLQGFQAHPKAAFYLQVGGRLFVDDVEVLHGEVERRAESGERRAKYKNAN
jgi:hypothetical protein